MGGKIDNSTASASTAFGSFARNSSYVIPGIYDLEIEDTNWVLTSSFIIFTMQTGKTFVNFLTLNFLSCEI
jgi:ammonium transporter, Amt family